MARGGGGGGGGQAEACLEGGVEGVFRDLNALRLDSLGALLGTWTLRVIYSQNYGPFLGPYYNTGPNLGDPKRDHNFDNPPYTLIYSL